MTTDASADDMTLLVDYAMMSLQTPGNPRTGYLYSVSRGLLVHHSTVLFGVGAKVSVISSISTQSTDACTDVRTDD